GEECTGSFDVLRLCAFVTRAQQQQQRIPASREIDPITWPVIYPQLQQPGAHTFAVAEIAELQTRDAHPYARARLLVLQATQPIRKGLPAIGSLIHLDPGVHGAYPIRYARRLP